MARPVQGQIALGNYAYLMPSAGGLTDDYAILAHGARVTAHSFYRPRGCSINYYAKQGIAYKMPGGLVRHYTDTIQHRPIASHTVRFGYRAADVVLGKILGSH
ncbi:MAG: hypothetical protein JWQ49_5790 [Edaphobacter sp.]|nr:hypothetical protein [Edaphobacter sp.]